MGRCWKELRCCCCIRPPDLDSENQTQKRSGHFSSENDPISAPGHSDSVALPGPEEQQRVLPSQTATPQTLTVDGPLDDDSFGDEIQHGLHPAEGQPESSSGPPGTTSQRALADDLSTNATADGGSQPAGQPEGLSSRDLSQRNSLQASGASSRSEIAPSQEVASDTSSGRPPFDVKSIEDLKLILDFIEKTIEKAEEPRTQAHPGAEIPTPGPHANPKSGLPEGKKTRFLDFFTSNLNDAANVIQNVGTVCKDLTDPKGLGKDIATESRKELERVLKGVGNLHWAGAGLLILASVLSRVDVMSKNKQGCMEILKRLANLSAHLVRLYQLSVDKDKLVTAATCIAEGAILCEEYLKYGHVRRFGLAPTHKSKFEALQDSMDYLYRDLGLAANIENLSLGIETHDKIPKVLDPTYRPKYPKHAVGIEKKHNEAIRELGVLEGLEIAVGVQVLLIYGMGGIGKTTLAKAICSNPPFLDHTFAEVEFGADVTQKNISEYQSIIFERLSGRNIKIAHSDEGRQAMEECFKGCVKPILLFIDNVFKTEDLDDLLPSPLLLQNQSRIVVTSRNKAVVAEANCVRDVVQKEYPILKLDDSQSINLLKYHVGEETFSAAKEEEMSHIIKWSDGLPLALEVVGRFLRKTKAAGWKVVLDRLGEGASVTGRVDGKLDKIFDLSYHALDDPGKEALLDITCLLRQEDMECVAKSTLDVLEELSLVKNIPGSKAEVLEGFWHHGELVPRVRVIPRACSVQVHDLCVSFGKRLSGGKRLISSGEKYLPSLLQGSDHDNDGCEAVEGLVIKYCRESSLPAKKLDAMRKSLRILILDDFVLSGHCQSIATGLEICHVHSHVPSGFPYRDLQRLQKLRILDIAQVRCDFNHTQLPGRLEVLKLTAVQSLESFHRNAFQDCSLLHSVYIISCESLQELPDSFCGLTGLSVLVLSRNYLLRYLPIDFHCLENLESVFVDGPIEELPSQFGNCANLRELFLCGQSLSPSYSFSKFTCLEYLFLDLQAPQEQDFHPEFENMASLRVLNISGVGQLQAQDFSQLTSLSKLTMSIQGDSIGASPIFGGLFSLQELVLSYCARVQQLPKNITHLTSLRSLTLRRCDSLVDLPEKFGELHTLEELRLEICPSLQQLPEHFSQLKSLKSLILWHCSSLTELPDGFQNLPKLETLELDSCERLVQLPNDLPQLRALKTMTLTGAQSLKELPYGFGNFSQLVSLKLQGCISLQALPNDMFKLKSLRTLELHGCTSLKNLPPIHEDGLALEKLSLGECESLLELPDGLWKLDSLQMLIVFNSQLLKELPEGFGNLPCFMSLDVHGCNSIQGLPEDFFKLKTLRELNLLRCESLQRLAPIHENDLALQKLNLSYCKGLIWLPDSVSKLNSLKMLNLTDCRLLEKLPEGFGDLPRLSLLYLDGCVRLERLPEYFFKLRSLRGWV